MHAYPAKVAPAKQRRKTRPAGNPEDLNESLALPVCGKRGDEPWLALCVEPYQKHKGHTRQSALRQSPSRPWRLLGLSPRLKPPSDLRPFCIGNTCGIIHGHELLDHDLLVDRLSVLLDQRG